MRNKIFIGIFTLIGLALIVLGISALIQDVQFLGHVQATQATVIKVERGTCANATMPSDFVNSNHLCSTTFLEYKTEQGQNIEFTSVWYNANYNTGSKMDIWYDPANPQDASVKNYFALLGGTLFQIIFGFILIGFSVFILLLIKKKKQTDANQ